MRTIPRWLFWAWLALLMSCGHLPVGMLSDHHHYGGDPLQAAAIDPATFQTSLAPSSPYRKAIDEVSAALQAGAAPKSVHQMQLLEGGEEALLARLHLIEAAQRTLDFQTFIWASDESSRLIGEALAKAAARGVKVRVLIDFMGLTKDAEVISRLAFAHPNLELRVYRPTAKRLERGYFASMWYALTDFKGANQRMHHKVFVADDAVAITGGRNVENSYFDHALGMNFKDRDALVVGPVAQEMRQAFDAFWDYRHTVPATDLEDIKAPDELAWPPLDTAVGRRLQKLWGRATQSEVVDEVLLDELKPVASVKFVSDLPGKNGAIHLTGGGRATTHVIQALSQANRELWIQSPYLVLGDSGLRYFGEMRRAKPELKIAVSTNSFGSTDNLIAYAGNVRSRDRYLHQLGMEISEYRPWPQDLHRVMPGYDWLHREAKRAKRVSKRAPFLCIHAKSFVVDERLAFVGSYNLDPRSAHLNTECGLIIEDARWAVALKAEIQRDLQPENAWVIAPRHRADPLIALQMLSREVTDWSPVDVSPFDAASAFELKSGYEPVAPDHPEFYRRYRDLGSFPGGKGLLEEREILGRLIKLSTPLFDPLL